MATKKKEAESKPDKDQVSEPQQGTPEPDEEGSAKEAARPDDQAEKYKSLESELGRLKKELGDTRKEAEDAKAYKLWYEQNASAIQQMAQQRQQQQQQQEPPNYDEQFLDKPTETVSKLMDQRLAQVQYSNAYQNAMMAKQMAKLTKPECFEGIEDQELDQAMFGGAQAGVVNPQTLSDPNAWIGTSWILRGRKMGYTIPQAPPSPMEPTPTESPGSPSPGSEDQIPSLKGDALTDRLTKELERMGIKKEDIPKEVRAVKQAEGE